MGGPSRPSGRRPSPGPAPPGPNLISCDCKERSFRSMLLFRRADSYVPCIPHTSNVRGPIRLLFRFTQSSVRRGRARLRRCSGRAAEAPADRVAARCPRRCAPAHLALRRHVRQAVCRRLLHCPRQQGAGSRDGTCRATAVHCPTTTTSSEHGSKQHGGL